MFAKHNDINLFKTILGKSIKQNRLKLSMTLEMLGEITNLDSKNINKIELGKILPNSHTLSILLIALEMEASDFLKEYKKTSNRF